MNPPEELCELLADCRRRGWSFDRAWRECVREVCVDDDKYHGWAAAFSATSDAWRDAYNKAEPVTAALTVELADAA